MPKKKFMSLFILCCSVPLLLAQLVLSFGWFSRGVSSEGEWQQQEVFLLPATNEQAHWRIAVLPEADCEAVCQNALFTVQQLYIGLGRKQEQVRPVLVSAEPLPHSYEGFSQQAGLPINEAGLLNHILLVDKQGLVLLRYPMPGTEQEMVTTAKAMRHDLLKLLNYDRTRV